MSDIGTTYVGTTEGVQTTYLYVEKSEPDENYFLDMWGNCAMKPCACLRMGWVGRQCPHWTPLGVKSLDELSDHFQRGAE